MRRTVTTLVLGSAVFLLGACGDGGTPSGSVSAAAGASTGTSWSYPGPLAGASSGSGPTGTTATAAGGAAGSAGAGATSGASASASGSAVAGGSAVPGGSAAGGSTVAGGSASATGGGAGASGTAGGSAGASATGGGAAAPAATGAVLHGTIPPDPATGFSGMLWLKGERLVPGSVILVKYQGVPTKLLPTYFDSSENLGMDVFLTIPGDYEFTAIAPDGSASTSIPLHVPSGGAFGAFTAHTPVVRMAYPLRLDTSFTGTLWLLGEHFMQGSMALVSWNGGPEIAQPLVFSNERSVGWVTATPVTGTMRIRVMNPTTFASAPVTLAVGALPTSGALPAPDLTLPPTSATAPFVGVLRVYGDHFRPGAVVELREPATGRVSAATAMFASSAEVWWPLAYPAPGSYRALVRNPDGQATPDWPFDVR